MNTSLEVNGLDVMLYYWDERDGPDFCGWWFGPKDWVRKDEKHSSRRSAAIRFGPTTLRKRLPHL